ncbi:YqeG family HAD IIIA-type phosphatase [Bacillaceae bacterium]
MDVFRKLIPDLQVSSIYEIDLDALKARGVKGIITDLDNTLVAWDRPNATPELAEWLKKVQDYGFEVMIVSNNKETRVSAFARPLGIRYIHRAQKPRRKAFLEAIKRMNVTREQTVVIGDQLFTDVLGGNRLGFYTILVLPVAKSDGFWTKFNRKLERVALGWLRRRGFITWGD